MLSVLFSLAWLAAILVVGLTRVSSVSVLLVSSVIYASPAFWTPSNGVPELCWILILATVAGVHLLAARRSAIPAATAWSVSGYEGFSIRLFNLACLVLFATVVARSGGFGPFLDGKYGDVPGGSIILYYTWNSVLLITAAINATRPRFWGAYNVFTLAQIGLIFVGGDRTLPVLFGVLLLRQHLGGVVPVDLLRGRNPLVVAGVLLLLPIAVVSKSIYTLLPDYGLSMGLFDRLFGSDYFHFVVKDFEPTHTHSILVYATTGPVDYGLEDLVPGLLAFLPGSSFLGVEPHRFSLALKQEYFSSWGGDAGVGANFWAQGWVVGGYAGVLLFAAGIALALVGLDRLLRRTKFGHARAVLLVLVAIVGFYVQRNSLEQLLSFVGRYLFLFGVVALSGAVLWRLLPKKRRVPA